MLAVDYKRAFSEVREQLSNLLTCAACNIEGLFIERNQTFDARLDDLSLVLLDKSTTVRLFRLGRLSRYFDHLVA